MRKNRKPVLTLNKETLLKLDSGTLRVAVGGQTEVCETVFGPRCQDVQTESCAC